MILPLAIVFTAAFGVLIYQEQQLTIVAMSVAISLVFYLHQCWVSKTYDWRKALTGDLPYQLTFIAWLLLFRVPHFMHYIPLLLSNVGKVYIIASQKGGEQNSLVHELIIFQTQTEAYILFTLLLEVLGLKQWDLLRCVIYGVIVKLKYKWYGPSRKAFN